MNELNDREKAIQQVNEKLGYRLFNELEATREWKLCVSQQIELNRLREAAKKALFIASPAGHAPCRNGGIDEEGTCPNHCICEWPNELRSALEGREQQ